jgi:hypothetical protein
MSKSEGGAFGFTLRLVRVMLDVECSLRAER